MIMVSSSLPPLSDITRECPESNIERQLLEQMSKSAEDYRCDTLDQLKFELSMRREIVNAAKQLNSSGMEPTVFHKSECNPDYQERTSNDGFLLKDGTKPSDTIWDIFNNGRKYSMRCTTAMIIVYYKALLEVLPGETFNHLFSSIHLMNWHKLDPLLRETDAPGPVADILLGDWCYFINPEVDPEVSELQGENVIVLPGSLYYRHGIGAATADRIIHVLNVNQIESTTQSAHFIENSMAHPDFRKLEEASRSSSSTQPLVLN